MIQYCGEPAWAKSPFISFHIEHFVINPSIPTNYIKKTQDKYIIFNKGLEERRVVNIYWYAPKQTNMGVSIQITRTDANLVLIKCQNRCTNFTRRRSAPKSYRPTCIPIGI